MLGDVGYNTLVRINLVLSRVRRMLRRPGYWSLAGYAKQKVKKAVSFIFDFEDAVAHAAAQRGVDGVVCGHIHSAADRRIGGVRYLNCGDWVDTCSAVVEHFDGRIEVVHWGVNGTAVRQPLPALAAPEELPRPQFERVRGPRARAPQAMEEERIYLTPDI